MAHGAFEGPIKPGGQRVAPQNVQQARVVERAVGFIDAGEGAERFGVRIDDVCALDAQGGDAWATRVRGDRRECDMLGVGIQGDHTPVPGGGSEGEGGGESLEPFAQGGRGRRARVRMQLCGETAHCVWAAGQFGLRHEVVDPERPEHGRRHRLRGGMPEGGGEWTQGLE